MAVSYDVRPDRRLVIVKVDGQFDAGSIAEVMRRHEAEDNWPLGVLAERLDAAPQQR